MTSIQAALKNELERDSFWKGLNLFDWLWSIVIVVSTAYAYTNYAPLMDVYEKVILVASSVSLIVLGWHWKAIRQLSLSVFVLSLFGISRYVNGLADAEVDFFLRFLVSSQSAIMWMSALYVLATVTYFTAFIMRSDFTAKVASAMTWSATTMGFVGLMVRWRESYLIGLDVGHIPVSNLYEVFILFSIITALLYLFYERRYQTRVLGGFVLLVISAAVAFLLWYTFDRQAADIQPLVPALKSYWMKIHVPANFIGYGAFALAAMVAVAYLIRFNAEKGDSKSLAMTLPELDVLDDLMYKSIALGFAFFTLATILGALWAAEAWGGYWSWDPKETWALIVWLNYAAWLHMRLTKGWRGKPMAAWAIVGLFVTLFAFLGVNMFLSGLHSYGEL
ncbi:MAG: c-type cytochrome biogenesis protein CcsB [Cycloclasticus sp.]|nr:c-type cytochrome biogenesis protein CcsB [Cycloclasticus sp.]MBQ0789623.1 c-type cytochrome biogenesis protein CcsB [Cycloclasticus sp.]